ncbi:hypothetical protein CLAIMM_02306 [Cladophialophora immunda]|nr:hypothetical protein CLAIMM_02306 [Cladophialophora immunda]
MEEDTLDSLSPDAGLVQAPLGATVLGCDQRRTRDASHHARQTSEDKSPAEISELQTIVRDVRSHLAGRPGLRSRYRLNAQDFGRLRKYLEKVWENLRYDYFVDTREFILRMISYRHEFVQQQLMGLLHSRLMQLCSRHQVQCPFSILGAAVVEDGQGSTLAPDNQMRCTSKKHPPLVLEVGYSQSMDSLDNKAWRNSQAVDLTLATPKFTTSAQSTLLETEITSQEIRNAKGQAGSGAGLSIPVAQITPIGLLPSSVRRETIVISVEEICEIIQCAENSESGEEERGGEIDDYEGIPTHFDLGPSLPCLASLIELDQGDEDTISSDEDEQGKGTTADIGEFKSDRRRCSSMPYRSPIKLRARGDGKLV